VDPPSAFSDGYRRVRRIGPTPHVMGEARSRSEFESGKSGMIYWMDDREHYEAKRMDRSQQRNVVAELCVIQKELILLVHTKENESLFYFIVDVSFRELVSIMLPCLANSHSIQLQILILVIIFVYSLHSILNCFTCVVLVQIVL
jgi:hypothetical protein